MHDDLDKQGGGDEPIFEDQEGWLSIDHSGDAESITLSDLRAKAGGEPPTNDEEELFLFDDFINDDEDNHPQIRHRHRRKRGNLPGMTPTQRFIIVFMLFLLIFVLSMIYLVITRQIVP